MNTKPRPREASMLSAVVISLYSASFLFFFLSWMQRSTPTFWLRFLLLYIFILGFHFAILYEREHLYKAMCSLSNSSIRFFEFPYFVILVLFYFVAFEILPFVIGLIAIPGDAVSILKDENLTMYVMFSGGAGLVACTISGLDIYPVNRFATKGALEHLIGITRDLMRTCNRTLLLVTVAIIVGWALQKVQLSLPSIYLTVYGICGFALGSTAVLGSRLTELLYQLSELEQGAGSRMMDPPSPEATEDRANVEEATGSQRDSKKGSYGVKPL